MNEKLPGSGSELNGSKQEERPGVDLSTLEVGKTVLVQTKNTLYKIEKRWDGFYLSSDSENSLGVGSIPVKANVHHYNLEENSSKPPTPGTLLEIGQALAGTIKDSEKFFRTSAIKNIEVI